MKSLLVALGPVARPIFYAIIPLLVQEAFFRECERDRGRVEEGERVIDMERERELGK